MSRVSERRTVSTASSPSSRLARSWVWLKRAEAVIPATTQTLSKRPNQFARGLTPVFVEEGQGCRVTDVDGNTYLDYSMALCAVVLGYNDPAVSQAIERQLRQGTLFSLAHRLEVELAERLVEIIPCAEMVRFAKNGSDVTSGAVRLARAFTGRDRVALCGYHGAQDWYIGATSWSAGVPASTRILSHPFPYNDLDALVSLFERFPHEFAAVILEPVGLVPPADGFLRGVVDIAHRQGTLVIFDEIVTGFRLRLGGAQEFFGVTPDLACFGKGMANGMPLAALVGRREIMRELERIFFSYTFGGETLSLAAAQATIGEMASRDVIEHLWAIGSQLQEGCGRLIEEAGLAGWVQVRGYPPRHVLRFLDGQGQESLPLKTLFLQETIKRGILTLGAHNLSLAHTSVEVAETLAAYREVFGVLRQAVAADDVGSFLEVDMVEPVFRKV